MDHSDAIFGETLRHKFAGAGLKEARGLERSTTMVALKVY